MDRSKNPPTGTCQGWSSDAAPIRMPPASPTDPDIAVTWFGVMRVGASTETSTLARGRFTQVVHQFLHVARLERRAEARAFPSSEQPSASDVSRIRRS